MHSCALDAVAVGATRRFSHAVAVFRRVWSTVDVRYDRALYSPPVDLKFIVCGTWRKCHSTATRSPSASTVKWYVTHHRCLPSAVCLRRLDGTVNSVGVELRK